MQGDKVRKLEVECLAGNGGIRGKSVNPELAAQHTSVSTRGEDHKAVSYSGTRGRAGLLHPEETDTKLTNLLADERRPAGHEGGAGRITAESTDVEGGEVQAGNNIRRIKPRSLGRSHQIPRGNTGPSLGEDKGASVDRWVGGTAVRREGMQPLPSDAVVILKETTHDNREMNIATSRSTFGEAISKFIEGIAIMSMHVSEVNTA